MKINVQDISIIDKLKLKVKEKDLIIIENIVCETCGLIFETQFRSYNKRMLNNEKHLCKKCRNSVAYYKGNDKRKNTLIEKYGKTFLKSCKLK